MHANAANTHPLCHKYRSKFFATKYQTLRSTRSKKRQIRIKCAVTIIAI